MKKLLIILAAAAVAVSVYAESTKQKNTGAGLQIGTTSSQKVGFFGTTPTNQISGVTNAPAVLATLTVSTQTITDKNDLVVNCVTGVTINAIAGPPSTNTINNLIRALQALGLVTN